MNTELFKSMSLSKKTVDFCMVLLSWVLLGIYATDTKEQMYVGKSGFEFSDNLYKSYTNILSVAACARECLTTNCPLFTFNKVTKECRIHAGKCSLVGATPNPAIIYYEVAGDTGDTVDTAKTRCEDFSQTIDNGVYQVHPGSGPQRQYYCYRTDDNRLWNVIQYRYDGSEDFDRTWNEYKNGFGRLTHEFWLGNDEIHRLTTEKDTMLRIEMEDFRNNKKYVQYNTFYIDDEDKKYNLTIGSYTGTAGDALIQYHNGMFFTTKDRDNDHNPHNNCAQMYFGGYWYNYCADSILTGKYGSTGTFIWTYYFGPLAHTPLKVSRMMVRKK